MDTEAGTKSANLTDAQRKLLQIVDDATHKLDAEERRAILDTLFSALYQDKCPVESELKAILDSLDMALTCADGKFTIGEMTVSGYGDPKFETIATGSTLAELIEIYIAASFFEPESPKGK